jgi:predicted DNA-binding transcriptional regulator AlpA
MSQTLRPVASLPEQSERHAHRALSSCELLRQVDVCARLGISDQTWMRWRAARRTPEAVVMPSGRLKWRADDIDALAGKPVERPGRRYFASVYRHGQKSDGGAA